MEAVMYHARDLAPKGAGKVQRVVAKARSRWGYYRAHRWFYAPLKTRVLFVDDVDAKRTLGLMKKLAPDYILVGCGHILKQPLIETARCGVFNAHPGLLPWARGSGVEGQSLEMGVPVGATLHYIDAGIDTGALIERRLLPVTKSQVDLRELEEGTGQLGVEMMVDAVERIIREGHKPNATLQSGRFPLFRWPDAAGRKRAQGVASSGRALELFEAWKGHTNGEPQWVLSPDLMEAPTPLTLAK